MTKRRKLSPTARARVFLDHGGRCNVCTRRIAPGEEWDVDHELPLALGGADDASNWRPAHTSCHRGKGGKTASDIGRIRKADRAAKKHVLKKKSRMPGSRDSKWKKLMNGEVVAR